MISTGRTNACLLGSGYHLILDPDRFEALLGDAEDSAPGRNGRDGPATDVSDQAGFPALDRGSPGEGPGGVYSGWARIGSWGFLRARGRRASLKTAPAFLPSNGLISFICPAPASC